MARRSKTCECGNPKRAGAEACDRCAFLDGPKSRQANLIAALRNLGGEATLRGLVTEMAIHPRKINEALAQAIKAGRVERIETEAEYHKNEAAFILTDACPARSGDQLRFERWKRFLEARAEQAERRAVRRVRPPDPSPWKQMALRWRGGKRRPSKPLPEAPPAPPDVLPGQLSWC
jgi:hypothetical protein